MVTILAILIVTVLFTMVTILPQFWSQFQSQFQFYLQYGLLLSQHQCVFPHRTRVPIPSIVPDRRSSLLYLLRPRENAPTIMRKKTRFESQSEIRRIPDGVLKKRGGFQTPRSIFTLNQRPLQRYVGHLEHRKLQVMFIFLMLYNIR